MDIGLGIEVSLEEIAALWVAVTAIRALLPAAWFKLDGKVRMWLLVLAGAVVVRASAYDAAPEGLEAWLTLVGEVLALALAAIAADGGAQVSGLKTKTREVFTLHGRTNEA